MTHPRREQLERLERALVQARQCQKPLHLSRGWVDAVMNDIRHQRIDHAPLPDTPWLVWRAAAVVALVISLLVGVSLTWRVGRADADRSTLLAEAFEESHFITGAP